MAQRRVADLGFGSARHVDVARPVFLVPDVTLVLEIAQHRSNGGVGGGLRQGFEDFCHRRAAKGVERVHDLALALAERGRWVGLLNETLAQTGFLDWMLSD
jgi:hypothetical protein